MKIAVGLSGGVDSSVACYLLKEQGHEVVGITMKLWDSDTPIKVTKSACFGPDEEQDIEEAREFAASIGIPYHVIDLSGEYRESIIGYFKSEYANGRTPNPCVRCNKNMKFGLLLERAAKSGISFDKFATGHYARVEYDEAANRYVLKRGVDDKKDQSYFLSLLTQDQLASIVFPLGTLTKQEVRERARTLGFSAYHKKESQDFYSGDKDDLLDCGEEPGKIVDTRGRVLGEHKGIHRFTIGQRRGLRVSADTPLYVTGIDPEKNTVVVGGESDLLARGLIATDLNWITIETLKEPMRVLAKIRYMHAAQPALVSPCAGNSVSVAFDESQRAITPGQFAVFYDRDCVIGAGVIDRAVT